MQLFYYGYHKNEEQIIEGTFHSDLIGQARFHLQAGEWRKLTDLLWNNPPADSGRIGLIVPEIIENDGRYIDDVIDGIPAFIDVEHVTFAIASSAADARAEYLANL